MLFESKAPIYIQIVNLLKQKIISGELKNGEKISSVRDLALELSVNPNTVQKALSILENENLLFSDRTIGRFVTKDDILISDLKAEYVQNEITNFLNIMSSIGISKKELKNKIDLFLKEE